MDWEEWPSGNMGKLEKEMRRREGNGEQKRDGKKRREKGKRYRRRGHNKEENKEGRCLEKE